MLPATLSLLRLYGILLVAAMAAIALAPTLPHVWELAVCGLHLGLGLVVAWRLSAYGRRAILPALALAVVPALVLGVAAL